MADSHKTSSLSSVSETRKELFCHKNLSMDRVPPTTSAHLTGNLPSWNLDNQHSGAASGSITTRGKDFICVHHGSQS